MATNPIPDIEVLKNPYKQKFNQLPVEFVFPSEYRKMDGLADKEEEEDEEWFESPGNFFYERKYIDL